MDRIIEVKVYGNHLTKDSNNAGTRGEGNATKLRITFDKSWEALSKTVVFWDAYGQNPVSVTVGLNLLEGTSTNVYLVPIPQEAMARAGELTFSIRGEGTDSRQVSITGKLEVEDSPEVLESLPPTPSQWDQMQLQYDEFSEEMQTVRKAIYTDFPKAMNDIEVIKGETQLAEANAKGYAQSAEEMSWEANGSAVDSAESARIAAGHAGNAEQWADIAMKSLGWSPYIGEDGYWYVYDSLTRTYSCTGIKGQAGSTVYYGDNPPEDADVWIDPNGGATFEDLQKATIINCKAEGEHIHINDSADLPLGGFKLLGKTKQTKTTGKNLIPFPYYDGKLKTQNGVTFTVKDDGGITINGTATTDAYFIMYQEYAKLPENALDKGESFRVSATGGDHGLTKMYVDVAVRENTTETAYGTKSMKTVSGNEILNPNSGLVARNFYTIQLVVKSGYKANNVTVYPMLEEGDTASAYEPYTGRKPSPSAEYPQAMNSVAKDGEVVVEVTNKNLLNLEWSTPTKTVNGVTFTLENGLVHVKGTATSTAFLQINSTAFVRKGYTYTLSGAPSGGDQATWLLYTSNNASDGSPLFPINLQDWGNGAKATASSDGYAVTTIRVTGGCTIDAVFKPMLEIGSVATEYEPYTKKTIAMPTPNGLLGVPVYSYDSGNPYIGYLRPDEYLTDANGRMWVCDEIDFDRGVYIKRVDEYTVNVDRLVTVDDVSAVYCTPTFALSKYNGGLWEYGKCFRMDGSNTFDVFMVADKDENREKIEPCIMITTLDEELQPRLDLAKCKERYNGSKMLLIRETPIEIPLDANVLSAYKSVIAFKPFSNISNKDSAFMRVEYIADAKTYIDNKFAELQKAMVANV